MRRFDDVGVGFTLLYRLAIQRDQTSFNGVDRGMNGMRFYLGDCLDNNRGKYYN